MHRTGNMKDKSFYYQIENRGNKFEFLICYQKYVGDMPVRAAEGEIEKTREVDLATATIIVEDIMKAIMKHYIKK